MAGKKTAKKKAASKKTPAKKEETLPAVAFDFEADAGAGMEGTDSDSFAIPFLRILQKLSPQCDEADAEFAKGAKAGMLFNSVSGKLYDGTVGVSFLPCAFQRRFIQWAPKGSEGGFKGEFMPEEITAMRAEGKIVELDGRLYLPDENGNVSEKKSDTFADTRSHFGLVVDADGGVAMALLPLSSTQIKKSKRLMSILNEAKVQGSNGLVTPPTWMNKVKLTTVLESNDLGSWYGAKFEADGFIDSKDLYEAGKQFHDAVSKGQAQANFDEGATDAPVDKKF